MGVLDNIAEGVYESKIKYQSGKAAKPQREEYHADRDRLRDLFRDDLFKENDLINHPKAQVLWELAWEEGHANGYAEVVMYFEKFLPLIK